MPTDKLTDYALSRGDLYVVILVLCFVIAGMLAAILWQFRDGRAAQAARLDDTRATIPVLEAANKAMATITAEMASRTHMAAGMGEAIRASVMAQEKIVERVDRCYELLRDLTRPGGRGRA